MSEESSNNMLTFVLIFMLGFFFSKLMPDICRSMNKVGIIDAVPNPSNGIIQGFNVGGQCGSRIPFTVGGQNNEPQSQSQSQTPSSSSCGGR